MQNLKILHAPTTVGGNPQNISRAEKKLGYESYTVTFKQNYFGYDADEVIFDDNKSKVFHELKRWKFIFKALRKYNVIHYNFGQTLTPIRRYPLSKFYPKWKVYIFNNICCRLTEFIDLKIARLLNKVTVMTYQGDDARQGDYCIKHYPIHFAHEVGDNYYSLKNDILKRERIKKIDKYADIIYAVNPDLMNILPKRTKFLPYANIDPEDWKPVWGNDNPDIPHIVHAPSHREVKGTKYILEALEKLNAEGVPFCYTLVENKSHDEARKIYQTADLLVDQLLAGYYGGLAVELMALGKPVIAYMREEDMHYLPDGMWQECPVINAVPETIYAVLKEWLTTKKKDILSQGRLSRAYVEAWHDPIKITKTITNDYKTAYICKRGKKHVWNSWFFCA